MLSNLIEGIALAPEMVLTAVTQTAEEALALAKDGKIISIGVAYSFNDGYTASGFSAPERVMALLGELTVLQRDIMDVCVTSRNE